MLCKNCNNEIKDNDKFCKFCGAKIVKDEIIKSSSNCISEQTVIKHLEIAGLLEKRIYELNNLINNISNKIDDLQSMRKVYKDSYYSLFIPGLLWTFPISWIIIALFLVLTSEESSILAVLLLYDDILDLYFKAATIAGILTAVVILGFAVIMLWSNINNSIKYKKDIKIRDAEHKSNLVKASVLQTERDDLIAKKHEAQYLLEQIYDKNILFPKYRNMIAVLTMHEYFLSGRCEQLKGHEGAYNLYETELRQNIIINSLEIIMNSLEQIKQNQYMLYQAIKETQSRIDSLSYEFNNISSTVSSLENNSKISAYNSKIAADNSRILSYIELAKY